jgi:hypothetical protein
VTTSWQDQRDDALAHVSRQHADPAKREFVLVRGRCLAALAGERRTKRQVLDTMRKKYESLRATYLRITGTTYEGWIKYGPHAEWQEVLAAAADDAVWDRLIERCVDKERTRE